VCVRECFEIALVSEKIALFKIKHVSRNRIIESPSRTLVFNTSFNRKCKVKYRERKKNSESEIEKEKKTEKEEWKRAIFLYARVNHEFFFFFF